MSEKEIESIVRDLREAYVKRNVEKILSFFAEDAVLVTPESIQRQAGGEALLYLGRSG
jgi:ketosteroid isomerase-like protein